VKRKNNLSETAEASTSLHLAAQVQGGELLTTQEVLQRLRISRRTLYNHVKHGKLPAVKLGARTLYHWPSVLGALLRQQREAA
jgi:excisionase family DNA binding protein